MSKTAKHCGVREIAALTGLNISTVSRALHYNPKISYATTEQVFQAAHQIGYFRRHPGRTVVIMLPGGSVPLGYYSMGVINALRRVLVARNYAYELVPTDYPEVVSERLVAGVISFDFYSGLARWAGNRYNIPVVCINDEPCHIDGIYAVCSDEESGMKLALSHLFEKGHRKILLLMACGDSLSGKGRLACYEREMRHHNLEAECLFLSVEKEDLSAFLEKLADFRSRGGTALICPGENEGVGLLQILADAKINVPDDLSLVLWETPTLPSGVPRPITTLGQDFDRLAAVAVDMLEHLMRGEQIASDMWIDYVFHERCSIRDLRESPKL